jgi:hypothetical protein
LIALERIADRSDRARQLKDQSMHIKERMGDRNNSAGDRKE